MLRTNRKRPRPNGGPLKAGGRKRQRLELTGSRAADGPKKESGEGPSDGLTKIQRAIKRTQEQKKDTKAGRPETHHSNEDADGESGKDDGDEEDDDDVISEVKP